MTLRPTRSARMPTSGDTSTPGRVKAEMTSPICTGLMLRPTMMSGSAGMMDETPMMAISVTPKTNWRFLSR